MRAARRGSFVQTQLFTSVFAPHLKAEFFVYLQGFLFQIFFLGSSALLRFEKVAMWGRKNTPSHSPVSHRRSASQDKVWIFFCPLLSVILRAETSFNAVTQHFYILLAVRKKKTSNSGVCDVSSCILNQGSAQSPLLGGSLLPADPVKAPREFLQKHRPSSTASYSCSALTNHAWLS